MHPQQHQVTMSELPPLSPSKAPSKAPKSISRTSISTTSTSSLMSGFSGLDISTSVSSIRSSISENSVVSAPAAMTGDGAVRSPRRSPRRRNRGLANAVIWKQGGTPAAFAAPGPTLTPAPDLFEEVKDEVEDDARSRATTNTAVSDSEEVALAAAKIRSEKTYRPPPSSVSFSADPGPPFASSSSLRDSTMSAISVDSPLTTPKSAGGSGVLKISTQEESMRRQYMAALKNSAGSLPLELNDDSSNDGDIKQQPRQEQQQRGVMFSPLE